MNRLEFARAVPAFRISPMKLVVDAMCAEFGGIRTYVEHLLGHWQGVYPEDELHVVVPEGSDLDTAGHVRHELRVRRPTIVGRPIAQSLAMHRLINDLRPDAVLATVPSTTVRRLKYPLGVVILDLRHELRPEQFTRSRRILRKFSYERSYKLADGFFSISGRSLDDLHDLHPKTCDTPGIVTYLGADHVLEWPEGTRKGASIAFAHHTNKNPDLIVDAWEILLKRGAPVPPLMIIGVRGPVRAQLEADIAGRFLGEHISLAPFLPEAEFQHVLSEAEMIVFPSDFEGFGLPVVEGMTLGKPVVIGPEKATSEIAGGHAAVMRDWTPGSLADAVTAARVMTEDELEQAREWGMRFTWDTTVDQTRSGLLRLCGQIS